MSTVKIQNTEFIRDMSSQAVLNTDVHGLSEFERMRAKLRSERRSHHETKERLQNLEHSMAELKVMIADLLALKDSRGHQ